jgi:hypothetical protein
MYRLLLVLALLPIEALAGGAVLTWTNATTNEDGSPLTDLVSTRVYYGVCEAGEVPATAPFAEVGPTLESYSFDNLAAGDWCFRATHLNTSGIESVRSNLAVKTVLAAPNPPQGLTVDPENLTAYGISQSKDRLVLYPVGTVAADTSCDGTMSVNGRYRVPVASVTYSSTTVRPPVVFAQCVGFGG